LALVLFDAWLRDALCFASLFIAACLVLPGARIRARNANAVARGDGIRFWGEQFQERTFLRIRRGLWLAAAKSTLASPARSLDPVRTGITLMPTLDC
jgi:hypothetical protein